MSFFGLINWPNGKRILFFFDHSFERCIKVKHSIHGKGNSKVFEFVQIFSLGEMITFRFLLCPTVNGFFFSSTIHLNDVSSKVKHSINGEGNSKVLEFVQILSFGEKITFRFL